jgi:hypothetical protein
LKNYYDLLTIERTASSDDVKRAFRREIARYHPDKVQHLGPEFQEIAATRAAELTEAYRILMDAGLRQRYDESLDHGTAAPLRQEPETAPRRPTTHEPPAEGLRDTRFEQERATTIAFLRRALLAKFAEAVEAIGGDPVKQPPFDAAYRLKGRRGLFAKGEPAVRLLLRVVPIVDTDAIVQSWVPAARTVADDEIVCLLLLGNGLSTAKELSSAISEQRHRTRKPGPVVVPVDMRDWEALFPPETPAVVRSILERLRAGR